jgi:protein tyrosine phosphatase (PTP) superfamily phosphohydrolase (DUF442 family)
MRRHLATIEKPCACRRTSPERLGACETERPTCNARHSTSNESSFSSFDVQRSVFVSRFLRLWLSILVVVVAWPAYGADSAATTQAASTNRPAMWAQPVAMAGVPNLFKVSDSFYRSAQPTAEGMANLKKAGIRTVVNLRSFHSDRDELGPTDLAYEHISAKAWHPEAEDIAAFLRIATDTNKTPALVHCQHGADRTGTMCAVYRVAVQGWTKDEAIREMTQGEYGFHGIWDNLIAFVKALDIEGIKRKVGISESGLPRRPEETPR